MAASIRASATLAVSARAGELKAEGKRVLDFSAGEPDFRPPEAVRRIVAEHVGRDAMRYTAVSGLPELRDAVAAELSTYHGQQFSKAEVLVSCGAKHSLANLFLVTLSAGDEVVVPAPYWVSYPDMVRLGGGVPVVVRTRRSDGWRLAPAQLEPVLGPRTRFLILNSPSNPTGSGYRADEVRALGDLLARRAPQAWIICDDIYRKLVYGDFRHVSAFRALEGVTDQVIIVDGVSKSYAMTGYRIGFLVAPKSVVGAASAVQGQMTSGAATPSQQAALVALTDPSVPQEVEAMRQAFARRCRIVVDGLAAAPGVEVTPPDGAFYVFADVSSHCGPGRPFTDDVVLATWLLEEKLVATVPGTAFGAPGHLRLSYATDDASLQEGVKRIVEAFTSLR